MNNKNNTSFKWDRIFGVASLAAILIFAVMLYIDCGASIRSIMNIGKTTSDEVTDDGLLQNNEVIAKKVIIRQLTGRSQGNSLYRCSSRWK